MTFEIKQMDTGTVLAISDQDGDRSLQAVRAVESALDAGAPMLRADLRCLDLSWIGWVLKHPIHDDGGDLREVVAINADFSSCLLEGCSFVGADLRRAKFPDSHLSCANFADADLRGANFNRAKLDGANFMGAKLDGATFVGADLTKAIFDPGFVWETQA